MSTKFNTFLSFYCRINAVFLHIDGAPLAKRTPMLLLPTSILAISMSTSNSQLRTPTSRPRVGTKQSKPLQRASRLRKKTQSAHSQLWSPHNLHSTTSAATHLRSTKAPLINAIHTLKPLTMNIDHDNPRKQNKKFEERTLCPGRTGCEWEKTRRGRREEGDEVKWWRHFHSTHPLGVGTILTILHDFTFYCKTTQIQKILYTIFIHDEYFFQPCLYKSVCLKSIHVYGLGKKKFGKENVIAFLNIHYR